MIPLVDFPNGRGHVPIVNSLLLAANVGVFLLIAVPLWGTRPVNGPELGAYVHAMGAQLTRPEEFRALVRDLSAFDLYLFAHGFRPTAPSLGAFFGSMFLHAGLLQLAGNVLVLWIFGDNVEHRLGSLRYLLAYLGSGMTATLVQWALVPGSPTPIVGAAGAICGVLGLYAVCFPRNRVRLLWPVPPLRMFEVPARLVLGLYLLLDNVLPFLIGSGAAGAACAAHLAAFIGGAGVAWLIEWRAVSAAPRDATLRSRRPARDADVAGALEQGRIDDAAHGYFALPVADTQRLLTCEQALGLAHALREQGRSDAALVVVRRLLRDAPSRAAGAAAHLLAGQILFADQDQAASAYPHLLAAVAHADASPQTADAARAALAEIAARQKRRIGTLYRPRAVTAAPQAGTGPSR